MKPFFHPFVYLQLNQNFGFAEGYNQALGSLQADYFLLLNSDVEVTPGWLEPMFQLMESDPAIGICQPKILSLDRPAEFEYAGAAGGFLDRYGYPFLQGAGFYRKLKKILANTTHLFLLPGHQAPV